MRPRRGGRQRGFGLVIAVSVIALLSLLGMLVLDQVYTDIQIAGSERASQSAMYIAEAGSVWGRTRLTALLFGTGTTAQPSNLQALPPMPAADALCPENSCGDHLCPPPVDCTAFLRLTALIDPQFANGFYRVAVRCNPNCQAANPSYTLRALGIAQEGNPATVPQRLIEQTVSP